MSTEFKYDTTSKLTAKIHKNVLTVKLTYSVNITVHVLIFSFVRSRLSIHSFTV